MLGKIKNGFTKIKESKVFKFIKNIVSCLLVYGLIKGVYQMGLDMGYDIGYRSGHEEGISEIIAGLEVDENV